MSSHHIVRDNQEPALLLLDGEIAFDQVRDFLEWSPFIVVDEKLADLAVSWGIKIDGVICDERHATTIEEILMNQIPFEKIIYRKKEDRLANSIQFLEAAGHTLVTIFSQQPAVFDTVDAQASSMAVIVIQDSTRWALMRNGRYHKWLDNDEMIWIKKNGENKAITPTNNIVVVESAAPFWIGEQLYPGDLS